MLTQRQLARKIIGEIETSVKISQDKSLIDNKVLIRRQESQADTMEILTMPGNYYIETD